MLQKETKTKVHSKMKKNVLKVALHIGSINFGSQFIKYDERIRTMTRGENAPLQYFHSMVILPDHTTLTQQTKSLPTFLNRDLFEVYLKLTPTNYHYYIFKLLFLFVVATKDYS